MLIHPPTFGLWNCSASGSFGIDIFWDIQQLNIFDFQLSQYPFILQQYDGSFSRAGRVRREEVSYMMTRELKHLIIESDIHKVNPKKPECAKYFKYLTFIKLLI